MKIHNDIKQNSVDWMILRAGKVTASEASSLVTPTGKVAEGKAVKTYVIEKLCEAWIGGPLPQVQGVMDMDNGKILEEEARPAFTLATGMEVSECAFITGDDERIGCSPDGLIGASAGLELKCPAMPNHIRYLLDDKLPEQYIVQVQFSLYVTQFPAWWFMSYRRNFPDLIIKVEPVEKYQKAIGEALESFWGQFNFELEKLIKKNGGPPNPRHRGIVPFPKPTTPIAGIDLLAGA